MKQGKLIVFEGIDGSGKSTQLKLLVARLKRAKKKVVAFDFPQYGKKSAGLVENYLKGKYGSLKEVNPKVASIFYAVDRFDAGFKLRELLKKGVVVVSDRYVGSNIGHQGSKISSRAQRRRFFAWLHDLEYNICKVPKPSHSFLLDVSPSMAKKLCENKERRKTKKSDIHEENLQHFKNARTAYLYAARIFPRDFSVIQCMFGTILRSPKDIHEEIWSKVKHYL